jgi:cobalt/nickel transport system permease protein
MVSVREIYALERLAHGDTAVHRLHPMAKLLSTVFFIAAAASFDRYAFVELTPYLFYPAILMAVSETPYSMLFRRFLLALPFCLFAGLSNAIMDRRAAVALGGGVTVSFGVLSLAALLLRTYLCVMAVLILAATTSIPEIAVQLRRLRVPIIFATTLELTYRYSGGLLEEAGAVYTAYTLRSRGKKGVEMRHMGSLAGGLLIRSFDRGERVYTAMKQRGFTARGFFSGAGQERRFTAKDAVFLAVVAVLSVFFRLAPVAGILRRVTGALLGV